MFAKIRPVARQKTSVYTVDVSPDGQRYLFGGGDPGEPCLVHVAAASPDKPLFVLKGHKKPVVRARFLDDGSIVSMSFDSEIRHWSADGTLLQSNDRRLDHRADACAVARNGKLVVIGDYRGGITGWNPRTGEQTFEFADHDEKQQLWAAAVAPKGDRFATGGAGGVVRVWQTKTQSLAVEHDFGRGRHIRGLAWNAGGTRLLVASAPDGHAPPDAASRVTLCDAKTLAVLVEFDPYGSQPSCCTFTPDGKRVLAAGGGRDRGAGAFGQTCAIQIWNARTGAPEMTLVGHTDLVRDLAPTPDSTWLLSASWDQSVRAWRLDL